MNTLFKSISYSLVAFALFGVFSPIAFAGTVFNNHPNDYPTVLVSNYTDHPNSNDHWETSISADQGDIIAVLVYYHNNGGENATSTKLKIHNGQNLSSAYTHTFSGSVSASNAPTVNGSATVNISSSQSLTYIPGSASWYANNQGEIESPFPFGQNGTEIMSNSGINIGTVTPGWASQGSFVVQYQVSENGYQSAPVVATEGYNLISPNQVTLNGNVNGFGLNPYTWFVYGTNQGLGNGSYTTNQDYQNQTSTDFSETVNVSPNTTYYYKACALTNGGGTACGATLSFSTFQNNDDDNEAPEVITENPTNIDEDSARLNGFVLSTGGETVSFLRFLYGTNPNNLWGIVYATPSQTNSPDDFYYNLTNLSDDTTYYYKACGTNSEGDDCGSIKSFTTDEDDNDYDYDDDNNDDIEVTTLSALNIEEDSATLRGDIIETNGEDVVRYFEYGEDDDDLDETVYLSGETDDEGVFSKTVYGLDEDTTYYFRACIESQDSNDEDCGSIKSFTTDEDDNDYDDDGELEATTTFATGITGVSAVLNGVSINNTNSSAPSFFQYGSTQNLGNTTISQTVFPGQTLYNSQSISGLQANKTYYYRIVTGGVYGQIKSFTTTNNTSTVIITNTTNTSTNTNTNTGGGAGMIYLALDITPDFEQVYEGDSITFDVDYRNLYNGDLEDVVIHVLFPEEIEFRKATQGFYSELDRSLVVDLGDLEDDEKGTILIQADVLGRLNNQDIVVTVAEGTYDHPTIENAQGSSLAHALNTILENRTALGAFAFGAGFFPGIFGWLLLILLLLLIVWISRKIYNDHQDRKNQKPTIQIN